MPKGKISAAELQHEDVKRTNLQNYEILNSYIHCVLTTMWRNFFPMCLSAIYMRKKSKDQMGRP